MQVKIKKPLDLNNFQYDSVSERMEMKEREGKVFNIIEQPFDDLVVLDDGSRQLYAIGIDCDLVT